MKRTLNIIGIVTMVMVFAACASIKEKKKHHYHVDMHMSEEEQKEWYTHHDTIYHDSVPVGYIQSTEWEYSNGQLMLEISVTTIDPYAGNTFDIMRYVHARQPNAKIEVNHDRWREENEY